MATEALNDDNVRRLIDLSNELAESLRQLEERAAQRSDRFAELRRRNRELVEECERLIAKMREPAYRGR